MDRCKKLIFKVRESAADPLCDFLLGMGSGGVSEEEPQDGLIAMAAYFPAETDLPGITAALETFARDSLGGAELLGMEATIIGPESWQDWRRHLGTVHTGGRVVITPPWETYQPAPGEVVVVINPSMAFGTGHHASTILCVRLLDTVLSERGVERMLDVGSGSGILAIVAAKLGAGRVTAIDTDPLATKEGRENAAANSLEGRIGFITGTIDGIGGEFDLITANISADVIAEIAPGLRERLAPGGLLVVSGLLAADAPGIEGTLAAEGIRALDEKHDGGWAALLLGIE